MAMKYQEAATLFQETLDRVLSGESEWKSFLKSAARLYKYAFAEQLMIYAQKPEATACAGYTFWKERMHRQVKRGSKGIALFNDQEDSLKLDYVFDVSDTAGSTQTLPYLWKLQPEQEAGVQAMLTDTFSLGTQARDLQTSILEIAGQYTEELEELNETQQAFFQNSVAALVFLRCGIEPDQVFARLDLSGIAAISTEEGKRLLGTEMSQAAKEILLKIGTEVRTQELAKKNLDSPLANRTKAGYNALKQKSERREGGTRDEHRISTGGGRTVTEHQTRGTGRGYRQVREDAEALPERTPQSGVLRADHGHEAERTPDGNQRSGERADGRAGRTAEEAAGRDRSPERPGPDGMGAPHEQHPQPGRGNRSERNRLSVEPQAATKAEETASSAFSLPQTVVDTVLRMGSNRQNGLQRLVFCMMRDGTREEQAAFFRQEYQGGKGLLIEGKPYAVWFDAEGIRIAKGNTVRVPDGAILSWEEVSGRVQELLQQGTFASREILEDTVPNAVWEAAKTFAFMAQDLNLSDAAKKGLRNPEWFRFPGSFPQWEEAVRGVLSIPEKRAELIEDLDLLKTAYAENPNLLRFPYHPPAEVLSQIRMLEDVVRQYPTTEGVFWQEPEPFLTQDEVDAFLMRGGPYSDGKLRIYSEFLRDPIASERAELLKEQYGTGGQSRALQADDSWADYDAKGLKLRRAGVEQTLTWPAAAKRVGELIEEGRFLTEEERKRMPDYERRDLARQIRFFYSWYAKGTKQPNSLLEDQDAVERAFVRQLEDPKEAEKQLASMEAAFAQFPEDADHYAEAKECLSKVRQYVAGDFTLFPEAETRKPARNEQLSLFSLPRNHETQPEPSQNQGEAEAPEQTKSEPEPQRSPDPAEGEWDRERLIRELAAYFSFAAEDVKAVIEEGDAGPLLRNLQQAEDEPAKKLLSQARKWIPEAFAGESRRRTVAVESTEDLEDPNLGFETTVDERGQEVLRYRLVTLQDGSLIPWPDEETIFDSREALEEYLAEHRLELQVSDYDRLVRQTADPVPSQTPMESIRKPEANEEESKSRNIREWYETYLPKVRAELERDTAWQNARRNSDAENRKLEGNAAIRRAVLAMGDPQLQKLYFDVTSFHNRLHRELLESEPPQEPDLEESLDPAPISVPVDGGWKTYPNAQAAEEALAELSRTEQERTSQTTIPEAPGEPFSLPDGTVETGGPKARFRRNADAIRTLKQIEAEQRSAAKEEQEILSRYVGWGGLSEAFDPNKERWHAEYTELQELLTNEEYEAARASTLNAHYTDPSIISCMYEVLERMGFRSGNLLEPSMGIGAFFGALPDSMRKVNLYGVELDSLSGRMAQQLYPQARIQITGFEKTEFPDQFFDVAIGNVPFGQYSVVDRRYRKQKFQIHDYFFAKSLDLVRPSGVMAFITSRYTMDKRSSHVRRYLAERAELLGAVRLPNTAFRGAGTSVTSDILFLRKRERPQVSEPEWVFTGKTEDGLNVNEYFLQHPEMVIGELKTVSGPYGPELTCEPKEGEPLETQLRRALSSLSVDGILRTQEAEPIRVDVELEAAPADTIPADPDLADYSYGEVDGALYYREHAVMTRCTLPDTTEKRIRGMIPIRDQVQKVLDLQLADAPDAEIRQAQRKLEADYDRFTSRYGLLSSIGNRRAFKEDAAYPLLTSLEELDEEGNLIKKADLFYKRTVQMPKPVTHTDTAAEALAVSLSERAEVDLDFMSSLCGKPQEAIVQDLTGVIFEDPETKRFVTADAYLSGNVREKLAQAEKAAEREMRYQVNVEALQQAQPKPLTAAEIEVRLGATWIETSDLQAFLEETFQPPAWVMQNPDWGIQYIPYTGVWHVGGKTLDSGVTATVTYGTKRASAYRLLEDALNLRTPQIFDTVYEDGTERRVLNQKETVMACQKQDRLKDAFREWIFQDPDRRERLCRKYNEIFNSHVAREYSGEHLTFPGMNPEIALRPHQKNAVARILYGGNTLLAHVVGAGKTFTMAAAAMESKRLGLCSKSLFVVPNHLVEQWAAEFLRLYPTAHLLAATKQDFTPANRKRFCSRIATGEYDAVIIGHSQFQKIPLSKDYQQRFLNEELNHLLAEIEQAKARQGEAFTVKQLERQKKNLEAQLLKLADNGDKDQGVVTFEQLGVDRLFVDEAHNYKNLMLQTKMRNVAGIGTAASQKASDLFAKCRYLDERSGGKGIVFATGTPVSNSMSELYTMQRYLQYDLLEETGMLQFDSWASTFGETVTAMELAPEGSGYRNKTRFARFYNLPELMTFFKERADIQTADMLQLPVPKAEYHDIVLTPSELQKRMVRELGERAEAVRKGNVDPTKDNMLRITTDGRKLALDERLIDERLDGTNSKARRCAETALRIWKETMEQKSAQLIFCDLSTPRKDGFDVYTELKKQLMEGGVPEKEIAFIHDANTDARKTELFAKVRRGNVRFLLGSTAKMGAGTNVQDRLIALHHLDVPWKPSDIEQQEGRILRQGNQNEKVHIYRYVTEGTFDGYSWQLIENKQRFISQIMTSKSPVRSCADLDDSTLSYAEVKALAAGNPEIKEKMELDVEVSRLKLLQANYQSQKYDLEDAIRKRYPKQLAYLKETEAQVQKDLPRYMDRKEEGSGETFRIKLSEAVYAEKEPAGQKLLSLCKELKKKGEQDWTLAGNFCGFKLFVKCKSMFSDQYEAKLCGSGSYEVELGDDALGNLTRLKNELERLPKHLEDIQAAQQDTLQDLERAKVEVTKQFPQEAELLEKQERLDVLNRRLDADANREPNRSQEPGEGLLESEPEPIQRSASQRESLQAKKELAFCR